jgi:methyl-accepting chemotaxis protein
VNSQQIAHSSQQQAIATGQVLNSMNSINQGAAQTATGMRETKLGIEKLNEAAMNLKQEI